MQHHLWQRFITFGLFGLLMVVGLSLGDIPVSVIPPNTHDLSLLRLNTLRLAQAEAANSTNPPPVWPTSPVTATPENLGIGYVGWDKDTNQPLFDPTAHEIFPDVITDAATLAKLAALDPTRLIYRPGFSQTVPAQLDAQWLAAVTAAPDTTPMYGVVQFQLPFDTAARYELEAVGVVFYDFFEGGGLSCRFPARALPLLNSLHATGRVRYAGFLPPEARIESHLFEQAQTTPTATVSTTLVLFDSPTAAQLLEIEQWLTVLSTNRCDNQSSIHCENASAIWLVFGHVRKRFSQRLVDKFSQ